MKIDLIQPEGWSRPSGYSNGVLVTGALRGGPWGESDNLSRNDGNSEDDAADFKPKGTVEGIRRNE